MKILLPIFFLLCSLSEARAAQVVPVRVYTAPGVSTQYIDPIFKEAETGLKKIGLDVHFKYSVTPHALVGYDLSNARNVAAKFINENFGRYDIIFLNTASGSTYRRSGVQAYTVTALNINGGSHLFQHELGHALGFDGHLSGTGSVDWNFNRCGHNILVKTYANSGLAESCEHRTFLGQHSPLKQCPMNYSWNVPVYKDIFKKIFECELKNLAVAEPAPVPTVAPQPAPVPTVAPQPVPVPTIAPQPVPTTTPRPTKFADTTGGEGGKLLTVTDFSDSGKPGTLRWAVEQNGKRVVNFHVSGEIILDQPLELKSPDLTITGAGVQITVVGAGVKVATENVILHNLRFRLGSTKGFSGNCNPKKQGKDCSGDTLTFEGASNVIVDNCSLSWSIDEVVSGADSDRITIRNSFIYDPLALAKNKYGIMHYEGGSHGFCSLFRGSSNLLFHNNLYANCEQRTPQISPKGKNPPSAYIANNYIYNYTKKGTKFNASGKGKKGLTTEISIVNNFYQFLSTKKITYPIQIETSKDFDLQLYITGNAGPYESKDPWSMVELQGKYFKKLDAPHTDLGFDAINAALVREDVLLHSGAHPLDKVDQDLVKLIRSGKGRIINSESEL